MATSYKVTDGTTEIELVYDASTQQYYKATYGGASVSTPGPTLSWHRAEGYAAELADAVDDNRTAFLEFHVVKPSAGTIDDVLDKLTELKRLVRQGTDATLNGQRSTVYLKVKLNGATHATQIPIISGHVRDDQALYSSAAQTNGIAYGSVVMLILAPYGERATTDTLKNYIANPAAEIDGGSGISAGWTNTGSGAVARITTAVLIGEYSQRLTAAAAGDNVRTPNAVADDTTAAAYVWLQVFSGSWTVILRDTTAGANRDTAIIDTTDSNSVSDKTTTDTLGNTWYRVPVSSDAITNGNSHAIQVYNAAGSGVVAIDGAYMTFGTETVPDSWASCYNIDNRADFTSANYTRINWVDLWGIPGDAPAIIKHSVTPTAGSTLQQKRLYLSRFSDGIFKAAQRYFWIESDQLTAAVEAGGSGSWSAAAGTSDDHYRRFTEGATNNGGYVYTASAYRSSYPPRQQYTPIRRVLACVRSASTSATFNATTSKAALSSWPLELCSGGAKSVTNANTWEILDLGLLNAEDLLTGDSDNAILIIEIDGLANGETADIDFIMLMPMGDGDDFVFVETKDDIAANTAIVYDGATERVYASDARGYKEAPRGGCWYALPGHVVSRYILLKTEVDDEYVISKTFSVETTVTPRSHHLVGVL